MAFLENVKRLISGLQGRTTLFLLAVVLAATGISGAIFVRMDGARLVRPDRDQHLLQPTHLDGLLPPDHEARMIWQATGRLDLSSFYASIQARDATAGRAAIDPRLLLALWLYAYKDGVGSGRALERLCRQHDAYRWLCGGVKINYHTLNDFRVAHSDRLDDLLTQLLVVLVHHGVVTVERISQDGTRVRASAGSSSFRGRDRLAALRAEMRRHAPRSPQVGVEFVHRWIW